MNEYLPFVTIDMWTMVFTLLNLIILYFLLKRFLFKPVDDILTARENEIKTTYKTAEEASARANNLKTEYEQKLLSAKSEADAIIKSATQTATMRSDSILDDARSSVQQMLEKSKKQIDYEKRAAIKEAQSDIASMAVEAAAKIIGNKISSDDEKIIVDIIDRM